MATTITTKGVLYINDKQVENSFKNITSITRKLQGELKKLPEGTKAFQEKAEELKRAQVRFREMKQEIDAVNGTLQKSGNVFTRFLGSIGANIGILSFSGYSAGIYRYRFVHTMNMVVEEVKKLLDFEIQYFCKRF